MAQPLGFLKIHVKVWRESGQKRMWINERTVGFPVYMFIDVPF